MNIQFQNSSTEYPNLTNMTIHTWPDTTPPEITERSGKFNNHHAFNINGTMYKKAEVSQNKWQWVVDDVAMKNIGALEDKRKALFFSLRLRLLTDAEMYEVERYGDMLNIDLMTPYVPSEKAKELNAALLQQFHFRLAANCPATPAAPC